MGELDKQTVTGQRVLDGAELSPGCRRSLEQGAERGWTEGSVK